MDYSLNMQSLDFYKKTMSVCSRNEYTADAVVPDTQQDIARILTQTAVVKIHKKDAAGGVVSISGEAEVFVLYVPEGGEGVCALNAVLPFSTRHEAQDDVFPVARVENVGLDVRVLNPRKVLIRIELITELNCYSRQSLVWYDGLSAEPEGVFTRSTKASVELNAMVTEKTFVAADEMAIPAGNTPPARVLGHSVSIISGETQNVGSKAIIKGSVGVSVFYLNKAGSAEQGYFEVPFSQLMEMPDGQSSGLDVSLMVTDAYAECLSGADGGSSMNIEIHLLAQAVFRVMRELTYIDDAYCLEGEMDLEMIRSVETAQTRKICLHDSAVEQFELQRPAVKILGVTACAGAVSAENGTAQLPVTAGVVYCGDDGGCYCEEFKLLSGAELPWEAEELCGEVESISAGCLGSSVEIRLNTAFTAVACDRFEMAAVCKMRLDEEKMYAAPRASVTVVRAKSEDMWGIAKKYRADEREIRACNKIEDGGEITGKILLIP